MPLSLLVTVGSTQFPILTEYIAQPEILKSIYKIGVTSLTIQHGQVPFAPPSPSSSPDSIPRITAFPYTDDLSSHLASADVVVSHAGAGTISETVALKKPLLVVVNDALMHDHQMELATAMERRNCCIMLRGSQLHKKFIHSLEQTLKMDPHKAQPPEKSPWALAAVLSQELGTI